MFTKANLEIYNIDVEDIITASGEGEEEPEVELDQNPGGDWG